MNITFTVAMLEAAAASAEHPDWRHPDSNCISQWQSQAGIQDPAWAALHVMRPHDTSLTGCAVLVALDELLQAPIAAQFPDPELLLSDGAEYASLISQGHGTAIAAMLRALIPTAPHSVTPLTADQKARALLDHSDN